eukprot:NODE_67_length_23829_cov_0.557059.p16 type:complete len:138 gc:universal NODE_67_length_23829_cov_0.557059:23329-23742(+)
MKRTRYFSNFNYFATIFYLFVLEIKDWREEIESYLTLLKPWSEFEDGCTNFNNMFFVTIWSLSAGKLKISRLMSLFWFIQSYVIVETWLINASSHSTKIFLFPWTAVSFIERFLSAIDCIILFCAVFRFKCSGLVSR